MKILLTDDSDTMRIIQKRCLNKLGIDDIIESPDGEIGLELFKNNSFDIILTDWNMPNMNGLEFLLEIRKIDENIPVIMVTTEAEKDRILTAIQAGVSDYIVKPFTPEALRQKLDKWIAIPN